MHEHVSLDWDEIVDHKAHDLEFAELCLATHAVDQLMAETEELIERKVPESEFAKHLKEVDVWITHLNDLLCYWGGFGKGEDEE